ncbi:hypothetical protein EV181_004548 [Coemansia sp. RSA 532]|nr:hypothetical protein EV181_004548 [Coemansia sp. RSA 532]
MSVCRRLPLSRVLLKARSHPSTKQSAKIMPASTAHFHTTRPQPERSTRDGDELSQPLEPADLRSFWDKLRPEPSTPLQPDLDIGDLRTLLSTIIHKRANGAVAMELHTQQCCTLYESLDNVRRTKFLHTLAHEFCAPKGKAREAATAYVDATKQSEDYAQTAHLARVLRDSLTPQYTELFDQINRLPNGFAFLVHMRADMLSHIRLVRDDTACRAMSDALMKKLETWIIGTLDLMRITWNSPACTIEKLGQYESVHAVKSWLDVKRRLGSSRRCFGFFHRSVPMEPLVFVWVALTDSISSNVQSILRDREPMENEHDAKCAIFYSINSQPGLSGVDLGNFLIKRVVRVLRADLPNISTFCTLSPLPKFRSWLEQWLTEGLTNPPANIVSTQAAKQLMDLVPEATTWTMALKHIMDSRGWTSDQPTLSAMEPVVLALGAHYLVNVKRSNCAFDPVANFHLRNGACLHRVNWRGNSSYNGLRQSLELMCNYNYVLDRIEHNNERYVRDGTIAVSGDDPYIARAMALNAKL